MGFPHSDIFGSKVARHLPEAYRRHAASFIAISSQGIHHTPLNFLLGNLKTAYSILSATNGHNRYCYYLPTWYPTILDPSTIRSIRYDPTRAIRTTYYLRL